MAEVFKFQKKDKAFFNVEIDGEVLALPIGQSMPLNIFEKIAQVTRIATDLSKQGVEALDQIEGGVELGHVLVDIYRSVVPAEQFEKLDFEHWAAEDLMALYNAWQNSAKVLQGISLGESQASEGS